MLVVSYELEEKDAAYNHCVIQFLWDQWILIYLQFINQDAVDLILKLKIYFLFRLLWSNWSLGIHWIETPSSTMEDF